MYPVHDIDALLILAMSTAAKRRPAELVEILAAADLALETTPTTARLFDSFCRLASYGLVREEEGGYSLTPDAQVMLTGHAKKAKAQERIHDIKEHLIDYTMKGEQPVLTLTEKQVGAAIVAHRAGKKERSWLVPKPKPVWIPSKELGKEKGKPFPPKRRKT